MAYWILPMAAALFCANAWAEQGCPPGLIPGGANPSNMATCAPIPPGYYQEQPAPPPRPLGKWLKTWGAVATDGGENLGVSTGKLKKSEAEQDARKKCDGISSEKCHVAISYQNQCVSVVQPKTEGLGIVTYYHGPSTEETSRDGLLNCQKNNHDMSCEVVYTNCTEQIFQRF
ncbi:DUF4189 domain-containing protein [Xanthomonas theicola]|nr:DUF4189 domain-containing protein [Xanthomonas theicola]